MKVKAKIPGNNSSCNNTYNSSYYTLHFSHEFVSSVCEINTTGAWLSLSIKMLIFTAVVTAVVSVVARAVVSPNLP